MLHHQLGFNSFVFGSQLFCPLAKRKRTKLLTKCLPFKWNCIPLSLIELAFTNQFSCPFSFLPQYHLIYKPYHKTKLISQLFCPSLWFPHYHLLP